MAPLSELWAEYKRTIPVCSLDPIAETHIRDGFFAGAAAILGLLIEEASSEEKEAKLDAVFSELQRWAAGGSSW